MLIRTSCFKQDEKLTKQIVKTEREVLITTSCFKQDEKLTKQIVKTERREWKEFASNMNLIKK